METLHLDVPAMYGDHHVLEVRRMLLALPGVEDVYASSCFQVVEVTYDPAQLEARAIEAVLQQVGYTEKPAFPTETGATAYNADGIEPFFRHSTAFEQVGKAVGFTQNIGYAGRVLWPCPGMEPIQTMDEGG